MPERNRGKTSNDTKDFAPNWHPIFKEAVDDLCFLLTRGYAINSALQLVGNRYKLNKRQRHAVSRISSSDLEVLNRAKRAVEISELKEQVVEIDGFNLLIILECALSGAYVFQGRDGTIRDISSIHGSYKRVRQTEEAIHLVGTSLQTLGVKQAKWYLDQPISNSGRLKTRLLEISVEQGFNWEVELNYEPDKVLAKSTQVVVSADGWILDHAERWFNLGRWIIEEYIPQAELIVV